MGVNLGRTGRGATRKRGPHEPSRRSYPGESEIGGPRCAVEASLTLDLHRQVVDTMMDAEEPFGEVETFIDEAVALDQDEKAALWLLAWSSREAVVQRREALAMLGALAWRPSPGLTRE